MKKRQFVFIFLTLFLIILSCVPRYQRYIEGIYTGSSSSDFFPIIDNIVKRNRFIFQYTLEKPMRYTIVTNYEKYDDTIKIFVIIFLKDIDDGKNQTEFLITVNSIGTEKPIKKAVNKAFESLASEIESCLEPSKIKILKKY
jgi:hypothetical protein